MEILLFLSASFSYGRDYTPMDPSEEEHMKLCVQNPSLQVLGFSPRAEVSQYLPSGILTFDILAFDILF
jgi:hypothetical protein